MQLYVVCYAVIYRLLKANKGFTSYSSIFFLGIHVGWLTSTSPWSKELFNRLWSLAIG